MSDCPSEKGFEFRTGGGQTQCVYKDAPEFAVTLSPLGAVYNGGKTIPNLTVESLKTIDGTVYSKFFTEQKRVEQELAILYEKIGKDKKLQDAFKRLQDAENARDTAPDAYQQARSMYYTLLKGETWKDEEKERISKAEVDPLVQKYKRDRSDAFNQYTNQQRTVEVVTGLKDRVLSLRDEMKYSVNTFADQLQKVENAINMERRDREKPTVVSGWSWLDVILNITIVVVLIYAVYALYPKVVRPTPVLVRG